MSMPTGLDGSSMILYQSVLDSDMRGVIWAVTQGADVETRNTDGATMLMIAAQFGDVEVADFLLRANASIAARSVTKWTALHFASRCGQVAMVQLLMKRGASVASKNGCGLIPLALSARCGHLQTTLELIRAGSDVNAVDDDGVTVLMKAAQTGGSSSVVQALLGAGADPALRTTAGSSPCHFAAASGDPLVVRALLRARGPVGMISRGFAAVQLSMRNRDGMTPLHIAVTKMFRPSLFEMLTALDDLEDDLVADDSPWANLVGGEKCWRSCTQTVLGAQDELGRTALHCAAMVYSLPAVRALLHRGAIKTQGDNVGFSPLFYALNTISVRVDGGRLQKPGVEQKNEIARCLARSPAFVARSLLWPVTSASGRATTARGSQVRRVPHFIGESKQRTKTRRVFVTAIFRHVEKN